MTSNTQQPQRIGLIIFALFGAFAVAVLVYIAIKDDVFGWLIAGFVVLSVALIIAASFIVNRVAVPFMDSRLKHIQARDDQTYRMAKLQYEHEPKALPAPAEYHPEVEPYRELAVKLLDITRQQFGDDAKRIASREMAQQFEPFKGAKTWENAIAFFEAYGLVFQQMSRGRHDGTMISNGKTARDLSQQIALPAYLKP